VSGREFTNAGEEAAVEGDVSIREEVGEGLRLEAGRDARQLQERLRFRGEREAPRDDGV